MLGDEEEPTPGAPCLGDLDVVNPEDLVDLESTLYTKQGTLYDVLVESSRYEVYMRVYSAAFECIRLLELRVRGCGVESTELLKIVDWPEVTRASMEGDCLELVVPADPPQRILNAMRKLGLDKLKPIAYRGVTLVD